MKHLAAATLVVSLSLLAACDDPAAPADNGSDAAPVQEWTFDNQPYHHLQDISRSETGGMVAVGYGGTVLRLVDGDWVGVGPTPLSEYANGVWSAGPSDFFVVSHAREYDAARIHRYRDGEWTTWELDGMCRPMDVWGTSSANVYVVTRCRGGIFHFDGTDWSQVSDWLGVGIDGGAADDVYVVGQVGVLHYDGTDWTAANLPQSAAGLGFWDVWVAPSGDAWVVGGQSTVLRFDGSSWTDVDIGAGPDVYLEAAWGTGTEVFLGGFVGLSSGEWAGVLFHYDGATWTATQVSDPIRGISGTGPDDIWAAGHRGRIYHYDGSTWSTVREGRSETFHDVSGSSGSNMYAVGDDVILRYDGSGWDDALPPAELSTSPWGVWVDGPDDVFVVGGGDEPILRYDGIDWGAMSSPVGALNGVWGVSSTDVFAVGAEGAVIRYDGAGWIAMTSGTDRTLTNVWGASTTDVFAVGEYRPWEPDSPGLLHFDGQAWDRMLNSHMPYTLEDAWGTGPDDVFAVGQNGLILHWDGDGWTEQDSRTSADLMAVWGDAPDNVYAVGEGGTVVHYDGSGWSPVSIPYTLGSTLHGVWLEEGSDVVVVGEAGAILRGVR